MMLHSAEKWPKTYVTLKQLGHFFFQNVLLVSTVDSANTLFLYEIAAVE